MTFTRTFVLPKHLGEENLFVVNYEFRTPMNICIMLCTGSIWNDGIFKASVPPISLSLHPTALYTHRDEKQKNTTLTRTLTHSILSELQYKYRFMHTMKASFPIFWLVSQHYYNAQLCIWAFFFSTYECQRGNRKRFIVCPELLNNCCPIRAMLYIINCICVFLGHFSLAGVCLLHLALASVPWM